MEHAEQVRSAAARRVTGPDVHERFQRALAIREKRLGPDHADTATSLNNLAGLYHDQGRYGEAEPLFRRALAIRERALGLDHPETAISVRNYAVLLRQLGRASEAEKLEARFVPRARRWFRGY